jgi:hypothetical protein
MIESTVRKSSKSQLDLFDQCQSANDDVKVAPPTAHDVSDIKIKCPSELPPSDTVLLENLLSQAQAETDGTPLTIEHLRGIRSTIKILNQGAMLSEIASWDDDRWLMELNATFPDIDVKRRRKEVWAGLKNLARRTQQPALHPFFVERRGVKYGIKSLVPVDLVEGSVVISDTDKLTRSDAATSKVHDVKIESTNDEQITPKPVTALDLLIIANRGGLCHRDGLALRLVAKILNTRSISLADFASLSESDRSATVHDILRKPRPERLARQLMTVMNRTAARFSDYNWPEFNITEIPRLCSANRHTYTVLAAELKTWADSTPEVRGSEITDFRALSRETKKRYEAAFLKLPNLLARSGITVGPEYGIAVYLQPDVVDDWLDAFEVTMKKAIAVGHISGIWRIARDVLGERNPGVEMLRAYVAKNFPEHAINVDTIKSMEYLTSPKIWRLINEAPKLLAEKASTKNINPASVLSKLRSALFLQLKLDHNWLRARDLTEINFRRDFLFEGQVPIAIMRRHPEFIRPLRETTTSESRKLYKMLCKGRARLGRKSDWLFPRNGTWLQNTSACMERVQNDILEITGLNRLRFQDLEDAIAYALLDETSCDILVTAESLGRRQYRTIRRRFEPIIPARNE